MDLPNATPSVENPDSMPPEPPASVPAEPVASAPASPAAPVPATPVATQGEVHGYCVKCKASRLMTEVQIVTTQNGRRAAKGKCPVCGTTVMKFLPKS
jgi:hypothetical protein